MVSSTHRQSLRFVAIRVAAWVGALRRRAGSVRAIRCGGPVAVGSGCSASAAGVDAASRAVDTMRGSLGYAGGAQQGGETPVQTALREAAAVDPNRVRVRGERVDRLAGDAWPFISVLADA